MAESPVAGVELEGVSHSPEASESSAEEPLRKLPYVLGLAVQVVLWMLVFLGIVVAVLVGGELTEFRYVGF
jgi:hypothetical protein